MKTLIFEPLTITVELNVLLEVQVLVLAWVSQWALELVQDLDLVLGSVSEQPKVQVLEQDSACA